MGNVSGLNRRVKIAVFRALYLGDMLCIIPTVRAIRNAYPNAHITLIGLRWQKEFVERFQLYFDAFVEFPGWPALPEQSYDPKAILSFIGSMQSESFDMFFQMQGNGIVTNTMSMLFGAKRVFGLRKSNEWCPVETDFPNSEDDEHEVLRFLKLAKAAQIPTQGTDLEFPLQDSELHNAQAFLRLKGLQEKSYVCVHPGSRDPRKRWPPQNFAAVGDQLAAHGYSILLTGSSAEKDVLGEVASLMRYPSVDIVKEFGDVPLGDLAAFITYSAGLISNDTGVSHIASALNVPSVIIFSKFANRSRWAPLNDQLHKIVSGSDDNSILQVSQLMTECLKDAGSILK